MLKTADTAVGHLQLPSIIHSTVFNTFNFMWKMMFLYFRAVSQSVKKNMKVWGSCSHQTHLDILEAAYNINNTYIHTSTVREAILTTY